MFARFFVIQLQAAILLLCLLPLSGRADEELSAIDRLYDSYGIELAGFTETRWGARLVVPQLFRDQE